MKKRLHKKLYTDKVYEYHKDYSYSIFSTRKVRKSLIQSGKIKVSRINLGFQYKDLNI